MQFRPGNKRQVFAALLSLAIGIAALAAACAFELTQTPLLRAQTATQQARPTGALPAQDPAAIDSLIATDDTNLPSFEVASVKKRSPENDDRKGKDIPVMTGGPDVSQFRATNVTAKMLIATAYGVREFQVSGGPGWINSSRFDINAKVEDSLSAQLQKLPRQQQQAQQALMIRSLLLDRFKLEVARSKKEGAVLALVVARGGPKLKEVPAADPQAAPGSPPVAPGPGQSSTPARGQAFIPGQSFIMMGRGLVTLASNGVPIANLVNQLSSQLGQQVIDQTGLKGTYQYTLRFAPQAGLGAEMSPPPGDDTRPADSAAATIFTALQEQLGLKLESTKGQLETITIDHIEEPSEN
jgi:uncharacterized protein (TIGR03435 family)